MIEDNHIALNYKKNNFFILIFFREIEKENNNSDIDTDNSFIKTSTISPLPSKYREYVDIFSESEARQLSDYILVEYVINTGDTESLYRFIYNYYTLNTRVVDARGISKDV